MYQTIDMYQDPPASDAATFGECVPYANGNSSNPKTSLFKSYRETGRSSFTDLAVFFPQKTYIAVAYYYSSDKCKGPANAMEIFPNNGKCLKWSDGQGGYLKIQCLEGGNCTIVCFDDPNCTRQTKVEWLNGKEYSEGAPDGKCIVGDNVSSLRYIKFQTDAQGNPEPKLLESVKMTTDLTTDEITFFKTNDCSKEFYARERALATTCELMEDPSFCYDKVPIVEDDSAGGDGLKRTHRCLASYTDIAERSINTEAAANPNFIRIQEFKSADCDPKSLRKESLFRLSQVGKNEATATCLSNSKLFIMGNRVRLLKYKPAESAPCSAERRSGHMKLFTNQTGQCINSAKVDFVYAAL
jgi:hypothetical protein